MPSIHDSLLIGYEVDGDAQTIVLHTRPHQGGGEGYIDITFRGVVAYHFEGDCLGNIVLEIKEVPASAIIGDGVAFEGRHRMFGWPSDWDSGKESAEDFFTRHQCRLFELTCSYGMNGWVAANTMEQQVIAAHRDS
jgi:hypothetical protein